MGTSISVCQIKGDWDDQSSPTFKGHQDSVAEIWHTKQGGSVKRDGRAILMHQDNSNTKQQHFLRRILV